MGIAPHKALSYCLIVKNPRGFPNLRDSEWCEMSIDAPVGHFSFVVKLPIGAKLSKASCTLRATEKPSILAPEFRTDDEGRQVIEVRPLGPQQSGIYKIEFSLE